MIEKDIDKISEGDLQSLVDNSVLEKKTLEYKQKLPGNKDSDKKEFLADVSSFANASGGDLIYGIIEDRTTGTPKTLEGLNIRNVDQEITRLDNIIRNGIKPRIPSINIKPVSLSNSKTVLIIRVPKSWISPHRVTFKGHNKFYARSSNGRYELDVAELRIAFNMSESITDRIREFREKRLANIFANETPVPFYFKTKTVLHLLPIISFTPAQSYDISKIALNPAKIKPIRGPISDKRYNIDGFLTYDSDVKGRVLSYAQLFRNGIIEAVDGFRSEEYYDKKFIPDIAFEKNLIDALNTYLSTLEGLGVVPPIFVFLALQGVKGYFIEYDKSRSIDELQKIDRDILLIPEVLIDNYKVSAEDVLRPCFNSIWNACGYLRSFNYDDKGKWVGRKS